MKIVYMLCGEKQKWCDVQRVGCLARCCIRVRLVRRWGAAVV
ncbi:MAG: hypothetical protein ACOYL7_08650 [Caldilinea sp.]